MKFVLFLMIIALAAAAHEYLNPSFSTAASTCVCTTVPCPVAGDNYLTVGKCGILSN